jgi:uncharacterized small protein (DUF1192 family)
MDAEDLEPKKRKPAPRNLDEMSIEALHEYIAELEAEIERARQSVGAKERARMGAEEIFRR